MSNVLEFPAPQGADAAVIKRFQVAFDFGADRALSLIDALHSEKLDETHEEMTGSLAGALHMLMWCTMDCAPDHEVAMKLINEAMQVAERKMNDSS